MSEIAVTSNAIIRTVQNLIDVVNRYEYDYDELTLIKTLTYKLYEITSDKCHDSATKAIEDITKEA